MKVYLVSAAELQQTLHRFGNAAEPAQAADRIGRA